MALASPGIALEESFIPIAPSTACVFAPIFPFISINAADTAASEAKTEEGGDKTGNAPVSTRISRAREYSSPDAKVPIMERQFCSKAARPARPMENASATFPAVIE